MRRFAQEATVLGILTASIAGDHWSASPGIVHWDLAPVFCVTFRTEHRSRFPCGLSSRATWSSVERLLDSQSRRSHRSSGGRVARPEKHDRGGHGSNPGARRGSGVSDQLTHPPTMPSMAPPRCSSGRQDGLTASDMRPARRANRWAANEADMQSGSLSFRCVYRGGVGNF